MRKLTEQDVADEFKDLCQDMATATGINEKGEQFRRPIFVGFKKSDDLTNKMNIALQQLSIGQIASAYETLQDARQHLFIKQAYYGRNHALQELKAEILEIKPRLSKEISAQLEKKLFDYETYIMAGNKTLSLAKASNLFWLCKDGIEEAQRKQQQKNADIIKDNQEREAANKLERQNQQAAQTAARYVKISRDLAAQFATMLK
jgi:hypothetical protein